MFYTRLLLMITLYSPWLLLNAATVSVELKGIDGGLLTNTRAFLSIYNESQGSADLSTLRIQQLHRKATSQIKQALQPFGYYQTTITKSLKLVENNWQAQYQIDKGLPVRIDTLDFTLSGPGKNNKNFVDAKSDFSLKVGDILNHANYESIKQSLQSVALAEGFLKAKFAISEIRVDLKKYTASIQLHFETGSQFLFGEVRFVQIGEQLNEEFLKRYIPFKSGDPYSTEKLIHLQTVLSDSDLFSRIEINQLFEEIEDLNVPLEIRVTPSKPKKFRFGLGYGSDSGARASAEHQRRVSPKGHILTLKVKTSQRINRIDMQYMMPLKNPAKDQFTMNTHYLRQVTESRKTYAGAMDFRMIYSWKKWRQAIAITYEREDYEVADQSDSSQLIMPNIDWIKSSFNNRIYPTNASRYTIEIWASHTNWLSDVDFLQLRLSGKWIFPLSKNGRLITRLNTGATAIHSINELPASKRFFTGGDQSLRGYAYEELGPLDNQGETIGGKYLAVASVEYEYRIFDNWGVGFFYDAGNSFNTFKEKIYRGYGLGIRWRSIVGPVRLDLGWPVDKQVDYPRLHLIIGLDL